MELLQILNISVLPLQVLNSKDTDQNLNALAAVMRENPKYFAWLERANQYSHVPPPYLMCSRFPSFPHDSRTAGAVS